jgi:predicted nucleotidyltransferase
MSTMNKLKLESLLAQETKDKILSICSKYGGYNVKIFGSYARGEATENSDLDLLMDIEEGKSLLNRIALKQELEDLLGIKVDIVKPSNLHKNIKNKVLQEAIFL